MSDYDPIEVSSQDAAEWLEAKRDLDKARERYEELTELFKKRVRDYGEGAFDVIADGEAFATIHIITAERFDNKKFKERYPDIWRQFLNRADYTRMAIKKGDDSNG